MSLWSWLAGEPKKSSRLLEAERTLGADQVHVIQQQLAEVAGGVPRKSSTQPRGLTLSDEAFLQHLCKLPPQEHLSQSLSKAVKAAAEHNAVICLESILLFKVQLEYSSQEDTRRVCFSLLHGSGACDDAPLSKIKLQESIASLLRIVMKSDVPGDVVDAIVAGALQQGGDEESLTNAAYTKWCKVFPGVHQVLRSLMSNVGKLAPGSDSNPYSKLPELVIPPNRAPSRLMLQPEWAWALRSCLPEDCRHTWQLLFNSQRDGQSFSTLMSRLGDQAPTLLLIQDKGGHLFGGYASQLWQRKGSFYGDSGCFIFGLLPKLMVYPATGINENFQWCGVNFSQLPNGIGIGGQVGHYGVYVDDTLDAGISRPIATFANQSLASSQNFEIDSVECWLVKPPEEAADGSALSADNTVLDRNKEARNFMELAGVKVNHSEGVNSDPPPELML